MRGDRDRCSQKKISPSTGVAQDGMTGNCCCSRTRKHGQVTGRSSRPFFGPSFLAHSSKFRGTQFIFRAVRCPESSQSSNCPDRINCTAGSPSRRKDEKEGEGGGREGRDEGEEVGDGVRWWCVVIGGRNRGGRETTHSIAFGEFPPMVTATSTPKTAAKKQRPKQQEQS